MFRRLARPGWPGGAPQALNADPRPVATAVAGRRADGWLTGPSVAPERAGSAEPAAPMPGDEGGDMLPMSADVSCDHALCAAAVELDAQAREATAALQVRASLFERGGKRGAA